MVRVVVLLRNANVVFLSIIVYFSKHLQVNRTIDVTIVAAVVVVAGVAVLVVSVDCRVENQQQHEKEVWRGVDQTTTTTTRSTAKTCCGIVGCRAGFIVYMYVE